MVDFENGFFKLSPIDPKAVAAKVTPLLVERETIVAAFKTIRDFVVFTDKLISAFIL